MRAGATRTTDLIPDEYTAGEELAGETTGQISAVKMRRRVDAPFAPEARRSQRLTALGPRGHGSAADRRGEDAGKLMIHQGHGLFGSPLSEQDGCLDPVGARHQEGGLGRGVDVP